MSIKAKFIEYLKSNYDGWGQQSLLEGLISDQLLSETIITLPLSVLTQIKNEVSSYYQLRQWGEVHLKDQYLSRGLVIPKNEAVCTSFDFHVTSEDKIKLIEVNTNAAFLALGLELYKFHEIKTDFSSDALVDMFVQEAQTYNENLESVTIIDDNPSQQRMLVEFLLYQQIFEKYKIPCHIKDYKKITETSLNRKDFIYNRYTDFYLNDPSSQNLRDLFNEQKIILSPNPYEYFLLADKQRMLDWQNQTEMPVPESLLKIYDLGVADREQVWSERKDLFFKPKNSYGSKQAYKGASISRRNFDEFYGPTMIAQDYAQPQEYPVGDQSMKYDLRCYAYKGQLQIVIARLYQGQTTNLRTQGGGFTVVDFKD